MAFCKSCGQEIGTAAFCPKCGANQGAASAPAASPAPAAAATSGTEGMAENVAGLLCYLFGWLSGLIFLLIDKRPLVKFNAAQAIAIDVSFFAFWVVFWIFSVVVTLITAALHFPIGFLSFLLTPLIVLAYLGLKVFMMYKAYQGEKFKLPIIGNLVEGMVK
jgi:uncharacterized membrane protein